MNRESSKVLKKADCGETVCRKGKIIHLYGAFSLKNNKDSFFLAKV
jgi:hypothetical protein